MSFRSVLLFISIILLGLTACTKKELITVPDNEAPLVNHVPRIKIERYVNRVFIDLLGREPIIEEMEAEVAALKAAQLSKEARTTLVVKLQTATHFVVGDTSYQRAYYQNLYNLAKIRCLEGASDAKIGEFGGPGDLGASARAVLATRNDLQQGTIQMHEAFARMIDNPVYDLINMNSFNFVNATFDNLLWRFPTSSEFNAGFNMVEHQRQKRLFGQSGRNKTDYIQILTESREMFGGLLIWSFQKLLSRRPTSLESDQMLDDFFQHQDIRLVQRQIMIGDEYANFE
ncbi:MAG: hypothetical protein AAGD05_05470 [Bacteroidota bacterium]